MASKELFYCERCRQTMNGDNFFSSHNLEKFPTGKLNLCKKCVTAFVNNLDPDTFLWILQDCDVPYIPNKWNDIVAKEAAKKELTGLSVIGKYLSALKLRPYNNYRWKDNEYIQQMEKEKVETAMLRQGYSMAEIESTIATGIKPVPSSVVEPDLDALAAAQAQESDMAIPEPVFEINDDSLDLTDEDKTYLSLKWGRSYKSYEWVALEQLYEEMMHSYDIQQAGDINTLKLACKASLKANQLLDMGDK